MCCQIGRHRMDAGRRRIRVEFTRTDSQRLPAGRRQHWVDFGRPMPLRLSLDVQLGLGRDASLGHPAIQLGLVHWAEDLPIGQTNSPRRRRRAAGRLSGRSRAGIRERRRAAGRVANRKRGLALRTLGLPPRRVVGQAQLRPARRASHFNRHSLKSPRGNGDLVSLTVVRTLVRTNSIRNRVD